MDAQISVSVQRGTSLFGCHVLTDYQDALMVSADNHISFPYTLQILLMTRSLDHYTKPSESPLNAEPGSQSKTVTFAVLIKES